MNGSRNTKAEKEGQRMTLRVELFVGPVDGFLPPPHCL